MSDAERVAVVTGAGGPLGRAMVDQFLGRGYAVACVGHSDAPEWVAELQATGHPVTAVTADLRDARETREAFAQIAGWRGRIDSLINNAAVTGTPRTPFWEIDGELWDRVLLGITRMTWLSTTAALDLMRSSPCGRIVNIGSNTAAFGMADYLQYNAAKSAIVGMTKGMARELGPYGICVNAVAPGLVRTARTTENMTDDYWKSVVDGQCLREPITPADVAGVVAFLGSGDCRMVTGQTVMVNGGATMGAF